MSASSEDNLTASGDRHPGIRYQPAAVADYPAILNLNETAIPAVNRIDRQMLAGLHRQSKLLIVARSAERIAGFALVLDEQAEYGSPNFQYFRNTYDRFLYMDRIVVGSEFRRSGVGSGLYSLVFAAAQNAPRVTCEVNVRPANPGSLSFHQHLGFRVVGEQDTEGGAKRVALMVREQPGR